MSIVFMDLVANNEPEVEYFYTELITAHSIIKYHSEKQ